MIINRLVLKNFGKFRNREILLREGINVICGENESGKSTLHTFVQSIFFGIRRMRGRASRTDVYTRYMPWENPGWYEGYAVFTCGDKSFRLERDFGKSSDGAVLFCETDGELLSVADGDLEMLLGNISETVYRNTVSVGQAKSRTEEGLYKELRDYLADFQGSGDMRFDPERALDILKEKKKSREKKEEEALSRKEKAEEEIRYRIYHEQEEIASVRNRLAELAKQETAAGEKRARIEEAEETKERGNRKREALGYTGGKADFRRRLLYALLLAAVVTGCMFLKLHWIFLLIVFTGILADELFFRKRGGEEIQPEEEKAVPSGLSGDEKIRERKKALTENLEERSLRLGNLEEEYREIREDNGEILEIRREIRCILAAAEKLQEAAGRMQNLTGSILQKKMSEIVSGMTEGKYRQVLLDKDFNIRLDTGETCLELCQVSYGTAEQVYLALRLACGEILCREEELPLVLDETFAMYDDKRLFQTLKWISRRKSQVILFSCNKREIRALEEMAVPFHMVKL